VRDLFERFLPEERRTKTLGSQIDPGVILVLRGDAGRGRKIFIQEGGAQCQTCHRAEGVGRDFGPDLSHIGKKYARAQILENILEPSKTIDPPYVAYLVETRDDTMHTGFLIRKSADEVVLKEATAEEVRLPAAAIKRMEAQRLSLMPEGLLQGMTAQEAADLIEYLQSLR
jgi:putative heme-binding domain-containing protein